MNESKPSILFTGKGPQISVCMISKIPVLLLAPFLIVFTYFPFMQSMHCSKSENSNGGRMLFLIILSILPLEIWPKRQCHNFDETLGVLFLFCFDEDTLAFTSRVEFTLHIAFTLS